MLKTVTVDGQKYQMDASGVISKVNDDGTTTQIKNAKLRRKIFVMMQRRGKMVRTSKPKVKANPKSKTPTTTTGVPWS